jgi:dCMP deaminase
VKRPNWNEWGLDLAQAVATRADCSRRKVGAVIMRPDHSIVATGYNGAPSKGGSCLKGDCPRGTKTTEEVPSYSDGPTSYDTGPGSCIALHAEQNALLRASWDEMKDSTLFVPVEPCDGCKRMICGTPLDLVVWPAPENNLPGLMPYHMARIRAGRMETIC